MISTISKASKQILVKYRELVAGVRSWDSLTSREKWQLIYDIGKYSGYMFGYRCMGDNRVIWFSYLIVSVYVVYVTLATYTVILRTLDGHFLDGISCLAIGGLYTSVRFITIRCFSISENFKSMNYKTELHF